MSYYSKKLNDIDKRLRELEKNKNDKEEISVWIDWRRNADDESHIELLTTINLNKEKKN